MGSTLPQWIEFFLNSIEFHHHLSNLSLILFLSKVKMNFHNFIIAAIPDWEIVYFSVKRGLILRPVFSALISTP